MNDIDKIVLDKADGARVKFRLLQVRDTLLVYITFGKGDYMLFSDFSRFAREGDLELEHEFPARAGGR